MGKMLGKVTDWTGITNIRGQEKAGQAGQEAAQVQQGYQQEALDYLRGQDELPSGLRTGALTQMGNIYGVGEGDQQAAIEKLRQNPMYAAIMGTQQAGEESILRNKASTGGLRTGGTQAALGQYAPQLEQQALMASLGGLLNLSQLPSYASEIAARQAGLGQTEAQGMMALAGGKLAGREQLRQFAQQERQYGHEVGMSFLGGAGGGGGQSGGSSAGGGMFSDKKLKRFIIKIGTKNGFNIYKWLWSRKAHKLGLTGVGCGVIAQEVQKTNPDAVTESRGYLKVNYKAIGV